jgi:signal transduction histidine kinase
MTAAVTTRRDTSPMNTRAYWLLRYSGFAVVGIAALVNPPHQPHEQLFRALQIACFSVAGLALLGWLVVDERRQYRRRGLPIVLGALAVAAGLAGVTSGGGQSLVAFAAVAAVAAGAETEWPEAIAVVVAGILPIWIVGPLVGCTIGTLAGYPLLIAATLSLGRNRRSYRVQAEQAAALVAQYERLRAEQRRADVLDERTRIAREIHDVLAHSLGALGIQIQAAKAVLTDHGDVDRAVEVLSTAQRMAADGLTETRRAVHALRVDSLPLRDELAEVVETHRQRYQVPVAFESAGAARPLPPDASLALLRTVQEALVNAAKHAPGEPIAVRLVYGQGDVSLTVVNHLNGAQAAVGDSSGNRDTRPERDTTSPGDTSGDHDSGGAGDSSGAGDTGSARQPSSAGGYGLTGMRERLLLLNGTLLAGPRDAEWAVTAELPLASVDMTAGSPPAAPGAAAR